MHDNQRPTIRIVIAEPCALLRCGIKRLLEDEGDLTVVAEAVSSSEAIEYTRRLRPDVLLLDLAWWNFNGMDPLRAIGVLRSEVKTVLLGGALEDKQVQSALELGVRGVVGKGSSPEFLIKSIRAVATGEYWFDRASLVSASRMKTAAARTVAPTLTPRETEIVVEIIAGNSNVQIASKLHISEETVKRHLANIYAKLGVCNRLQLAMFAVGNRAAQVAIA